MVGWHHRLNGPEFEKNPVDGKGQGSLVCCSPWGCKELDTAQQMNNDKKKNVYRTSIPNESSEKDMLTNVNSLGKVGLLYLFIEKWQTFN